MPRKKRRPQPPPLGQQIAEARKAAGLTQAQVAERIAGLSQSRLSQIERGGRKGLHNATLCRIADAIGVSVLMDAGGIRLVPSGQIEVRESD